LCFAQSGQGQALPLQLNANVTCSRSKGRGESAQKGTASRTLRAAQFFFDQAGRVERHIEYYGYYVEAAIVFACMVLEHLKNEKPKAKEWIKSLEKKNLLIKDLKEKRNYLSHEHPISRIPSQTDDFYPGEQPPETKATREMLRDQLSEIEAIVDECERQFK
jgi:hypothetical protein